MPITGNKGEWSEAYVLLKLLADGRLNAADSSLEPLADVFYPLVKVIKHEADQERAYVLNGNIKVVDGLSNEVLFEVPVARFLEESKLMLDGIKASSGSFALPASENFLNSIDVHSLSAGSANTKDIIVVVHDMVTGKKPELGFSIKSLIGKDATLFNPGAGTNFIYELDAPRGLDFNVEDFNRETFVRSRISARLNRLEELGFSIRFARTQSNTLELNLTLIDSSLPQILGFILLDRFKSGRSSIYELLARITEANPLKFDLSCGHPFYSYKMKSFLVDAALGMTPEKVWNGVYDATGGIIIVKETGDLVCYHIYNRNEFQTYLIENTRLEQAATSEDSLNPGFVDAKKSKPYKYGWVYEENGKYFIKLNLQVRFK